jgi:N-acyl-D-aspartate/D-glutamate deacylase
LKQINNLSRQVESYQRDASAIPGEYLERRILLLRFSEKRFPFSRKSNSDQQLEDLFRSIDNLKREYKNLQDLIGKDPELKKLIDKKLSEISDNKIKI